MGYYDTRGRWVATAPSAANQGSNVNYEARAHWDGAPADLRSRSAWLEQRIRNGLSDGRLSQAEGRDALRSLDSIRREERGLRHYRGRLGRRDEIRLQAKLDAVAESVRWTRGRDSHRN